MEADRQKKIFLLRILVLSFALLIFGAWIFNLKGEIKTAKENVGQIKDEDAVELKQEFNNILDRMNKEIDELKAAKEQAIAPIVSSSSLPEIPLLIATSSATSSLLATSSEPILTGKENSNCPEYIDCMPTIGEARPCVVPPGCEGKTIIAY